MSSSQHVFGENDEDDQDMEDPPENPAMLQEDLQTSSADHIAGAGGPAAFFQQQLPGQNMMQPTVASNSYPGQAPQSTTTPTSAQISGSAGPLTYATMPNVPSNFVQQAANFIQSQMQPQQQLEQSQQQLGQPQQQLGQFVEVQQGTSGVQPAAVPTLPSQQAWGPGQQQLYQQQFQSQHPVELQQRQQQLSPSPTMAFQGHQQGVPPRR